MLGSAWTVHAAGVVPLGGLALTMDPLAGFFLALVGLTAIPASVYAIGYTAGAPGGRAAYLLFVAAMGLVPLAANLMTFAIAWELMSLASYLLVVEGARGAGRVQARAAVRAAWVYALMTHAGLACLLAAMLMLAGWTGSTAFADWRAAAPGLSAGERHLAFALLALGFASKAGVIPVHIWLPLAHPAAPSHVSALMSGVMIKLGVYGLVRAGLDWLGPAPTPWGVALLAAGVVSAVVGILSALVEDDLKRLLAFSSIENIGIVLIGLGAALLFQQAALAPLAVLALTAALYHTANHAAFKSLLFLGAGAIVHGTGTRDLNALGGLVRRMPWTAATFLVGAVAIAALPPLNGFVSEWLTFLALLQNVALDARGLNLLFTVGVAALALTGGLAVACFVKAFGIAFLALPRTPAAAEAHEAPPTMRAAMVALAAACAALGLAAAVVTPALARVAASRVPAEAPIAVADWSTLRVSGDFGSLSPAIVAVALAGGLLLPLLLLRLAGAEGRRRYAETWGCGRLLQTARMEYTSTAFANPFTRVFDFFYRPVARLDVRVHPESRFFVQRIAYDAPRRSVFDAWLYAPVVRALRRTSQRARAIQSGSASLYLVYILAALLVMLVLA
jgi:hydrogenase-4 component B